MRALFVLLILAFPAAILAGCVTAPQPDVAPASVASSSDALWYEKALAADKEHDHKNISQHQGASSPNFKLLGHDPLLTDAYQGKPAFGYGCGGIATTAAGKRYVVVNGFQNDLTFALVDVTNATEPKKVGEFYAKSLGSYDADVTPDGKFVVLAFDGIARAPGGVPLPVPASGTAPSLGFRGACGDVRFALPDAAFTNGIVLIDIANPAKPTYADWNPTPGFNLHSVSTASIDNVTWVMGSELGFTHSTSYYVFDQIQDTPLGAKLVHESFFDSPPVTTGNTKQAPITNGHTDVSLAKHPITKQTLAYLADWEGGVIVLDMSVPQLPRMIAQWSPSGSLQDDASNLPPNGFLDSGPCYHNAIHEVLAAPSAWDGKHYVFAGQECPMKVDEKAPGGQVFVLDDTDPANLKLVGEWHLPKDTGRWTVEYQASPHYLALANRTLFVSDYHAGLWAADVSTPETLKSPPSIGVYLPALAPPVPPKKQDIMPFDEQVNVFPDGTIVLNEDTTGVYVLAFDAAHPMTPAPPFKYA